MRHCSPCVSPGPGYDFAGMQAQHAADMLEAAVSREVHDLQFDKERVKALIDEMLEDGKEGELREMLANLIATAHITSNSSIATMKALGNLRHEFEVRVEPYAYRDLEMGSAV